MVDTGDLGMDQHYICSEFCLDFAGLKVSVHKLELLCLCVDSLQVVVQHVWMM